jgi:hypothetical protein
VWQFGLYPLGANRTRLVSRGTERYANTVGTWLFMRVMEPAAFIMTRRMLLGVKERAEALRSRAARPVTHQAERRIEGMSTFGAFVTRHPVLAYFALTFAISWGGLLAIGEPGGQRVTGLALVGYGLALGAAWWAVVAVIAAVTRRRVVHHAIQTRAA